MRVFISWSGERSRELAKIFSDWLPAVVQAVKPYFTPDDIEKGARWNSEISDELENSSVGLIFLTRGNLSAPWIMFEAGALAKSLKKSRVVPILFDVEASELQGPLLQFQAAEFRKEDILKLTKTINSSLGDASLNSTVLESVFNKWWPELEENIKKILSKNQSNNEQEQRSDRELIEEILDLNRSMFYGSKISFQSSESVDPILVRRFEDLEFTSRLSKKLRAAGIVFIGDLIQLNEMKLLVENDISENELMEIKDVLAQQALSLGMKLSNWSEIRKVYN